MGALGKQGRLFARDNNLSLGRRLSNGLRARW